MALHNITVDETLSCPEKIKERVGDSHVLLHGVTYFTPKTEHISHLSESHYATLSS